MANFTFSDVYGPNYGHMTTRMESIPEQSDQEALADDTQANINLHQATGERRNIIIVIVAVFVLLIIFSIFS